MFGRRSTKKVPILRITVAGYSIDNIEGDSAVLAISERIHAQIRGLNTASKNIQDGIALIQTIQEALNTIHAVAQRMRELAIEMASDTLTNNDREKYDVEFKTLQQKIQAISIDTQFNKKALINGNYANEGIKIHVGANSGQNIELHISDMDIAALSIEHVSVALWENADQAINMMDDALNKVSYERTKLETYQNWLEQTDNGHQKTIAYLQNIELRIQDIKVRIREVKSRIRFSYVNRKWFQRLQLKMVLYINQRMLILHMQRAQSTVKSLENRTIKSPIY
ncbi:flagellin [Lysinibacillus sp. FSL H8-0500]|uniref:flagellin N-terminal helical domain-containing protein n=1 Tax=Lysinibacillus sp. FSL H8-0500 TaxID=2921393 RepID=UPI0031014EC4